MERWFQEGKLAHPRGSQEEKLTGYTGRKDAKTARAWAKPE